MSLSPPEGFQQIAIDVGFGGMIGPLYVRPKSKNAAMGFWVAEKHLNPAGICHGGMMMTVADMAMGFAALMATGRRAFPPSINNTYDFLKPGQLGDWLETDIPFINPTRSMAFADGMMMRGDEPIMRFNGICKMPKEDDPRFAGHPVLEAALKSFGL